MNCCNTDIFFSNYYHLQSVRFESTNYYVWLNKVVVVVVLVFSSGHCKVPGNFAFAKPICLAFAKFPG